MAESGNLIIGAAYENNNNNHQFKGKLDDIRIYSSALSAEEIKVLYDKESEGSDLSTIIVPAGSTSAVKYVFAGDDEVMGESDEKLKIAIDTVTNGNKSNTSNSVDITIKDNDFLPDVTLSVEGTELTEGGSGFSTVTASLSVATTQLL